MVELFVFNNDNNNDNNDHNNNKNFTWQSTFEPFNLIEEKDQ